MLTLNDKDQSAIQMLYGFALCALALITALWFVGNIYVITAIVAYLLIKDGMPNFVMGLKCITEKKKP